MKLKLIPLILLVVAGAAVAFLILASRASAPAGEDRGPSVIIGAFTIPVEIADTPEKRSRGLSGRESLEEGRGMLFVFSRPDFYRFWMPDMHFPLDMIWIATDLRVVGITENAPPLSDTAKLVWYTPPAPAQYVLEVNAGFAAEHAIRIGDQVSFRGVE